MELFKILGTIAIDNSEAKKGLGETSKGAKDAAKDVDGLSGSGEKAGAKLSAAFSKVGSVFLKMFEKDNTKNVEKSFDSLSAATEKNKEKLEELKNEYKNMYIQHGKNSSEAKKVKSEIKKLSGEINKNEKQMDKASGAADKFDKSLDDVGKAADKADSKLSKFFSGVGKGSLKLAKWTAVGIGAATTALGALTVKSLSAAGDLEQNIGGAESVFKELGGTISEMSTTIITGYDEATGKAITATSNLETVSKEAYKNMGLSQAEYLATANKMGALFQGAGFETQEALDLSSQAMQRAADVASIMGIDTASAMEAVAGAAKGNFTMMDNLGVAMNDTAIAAYAQSKGINKSTAEMSQQEKIALAMEMFLDKTSYAAGNYAKENETLAGSLATAKSAFTNFLAGTGSVEDLVSSFSNVGNVIVKMLDEMFPSLMTGLTQMVDQIAPLIPPLLEKILPGLVEGATSLINGLVAALPSVINTLLDALPALVEGVMTIVNALIAALPGIVQSLVAALVTLLPLLIEALVSMAVALCTMLPQIIQPIIDNLPTLIISIVNALIQNLPALIEGIVQLAMGIVQAIPQIIQALVDALPQVVSLLVQAILNNLPAIIMGLIQVVMGIVVALPQILGSLIAAIPAALSGIWDGIKSVFSGLAPKIGEWLSSAFNKVKEWASNMGAKAKETGTTFLTNTVNFFKQLPGKIWDWLKNVVNKVKEWTSNMATKAKETGTDFVNNVIDFFKELPGKVWEWLSNVVSKIKDWATDMVTKGKEAASKLLTAVVDKIKEMPGKIKDVGKNLVEGIWKGISNSYEWIKGKIKEWVGNVTKFLKKLFGIKSPSVVMRDEVGRMLGEGVAVGIDLSTEKVESSMEKMGKAILEAADKRLDEYKTYNDMTLADEVAFWDSVRVQCQEGTDARLKADKNYLKAKKDLNKQLLEAEQDLQGELADIQQSVIDRTNEIMGMTNFGEALHHDEIFGNLKQEVFSLEQYEKTMADLEKKIGGTKAFEDIKAGGLNNLNKAYEMAYFMPEDQLNEYVKLYSEKYALAQKYAQQEMSDEVGSRTVKAYQKYNETCASLGVEIVGSTQTMQEGVSGAFETIEGSITNVADAFTKLKELFASFDWSSIAPGVASLVVGTETSVQSPDAYSIGTNKTASEQDNWLVSFLERFLDSLRGMKVQLDSGALVGELVIPMDEALGELTIRKDRGR